MARIVAVTSCPTGIAHSLMAAEALRKTASLIGEQMLVEVHGAEGTTGLLSEEEIAAADVVILAADIHVELERFEGKPIFEISTSKAIRETRAVIEGALALVPQAARSSAASAATNATATATATNATSATAASASARASVEAERSGTNGAKGKRIVAVTACPTGIAHTFMAADALKKAALAHGDEIKVETQGSVGSRNQLTPEEIAAADVVIVAADTHVDLARFAGKPLYQTSVGAAVKGAPQVLEAALSEAAEPAQAGAAQASAKQLSAAKAKQSSERSGPYKHLLTGVSYMLPIVVAGGLTIALSFVFGINAFKVEGSPAAALMSIGGGAAFSLIVPVLSGFIAFSIADRPGLAPGLIGGALAYNLKAGFLGGIVAGFLAGYVAKWLRDTIKLPVNFEGLKPVLIIPFLSTLIVGLAMVYVIGTPVRLLMEAMTTFLQGMGTTNAVILGLLLGGMMAIDMGGPINKAAYTFAVGLLTTNTFTPMAAVMAAGMTPPLALSLATMLGKNRFSRDEQEAGKAAGVLGLSFITEGAIPFAAKDPLRVIPSMVAGSAVTGALSMYFGCGLRAPHGGVFVLAIPNAVSHVGPYIVAILAGTAVSTIALLIVKRPLGREPAKAPGLA
jgi:PTS system fructose-specific IIC component